MLFTPLSYFKKGINILVSHYIVVLFK